jgi:tRNA pseudouridine38-40 synthase
MRHFFHIGYHGYNYRGWQRQPNVTSVQEVIEDTLSKILKKPIIILGCGRTDAMVSASQYFFHIDTNEAWDFDLKFRLNKALPDDIAVFDIFKVDDDQHARFSVSQRTYDFFFHTYKDPFLARTSSFYLLDNLDIENMKKAVALFPKYENYGVFCKNPDKHNTTICKVSSTQLYIDPKEERFRFEISANRFLKTMIRILAGKIIEIGRREFTVEQLENCLATQTAPKTIIPAHPQGLYLSKVVYPFLEMPVRSEFAGVFQQNKEIEWKKID